MHEAVTSRLTLERPHPSLVSAFHAFTADMRAHGEPVWAAYSAQDRESDADFVARLVRRETTPEAPLVPETVYWAVVEGAVAGRISLRHRLEGNLKIIGGHIGYEVCPTFRRKGHATEMLRQILLTPKAHEIKRLLLTCAPDNVASNKTILTNGGVLEKTVFVESLKADRHHYWIEL